MSFRIPIGYIVFTLLVAAGLFASCTDPKSSESPKDSAVPVLQAFTDAKNSKDVVAMKATLNKGTLETIQDVAETKGQTVDEYLLPGNTTPLNRPEMPQTRNEKIEGDIATVEIKRHPGEPWRKLTFVKEGGAWKMDLNRFLGELYPTRPGSDQNAPPPPSSR